MTSQSVKSTMTAEGYEDVSTGGGCMAWRKDLADQSYILICTEDQGIDGPSGMPIWLVGRHSDDGFVEVQESVTLARALTIADVLPGCDSTKDISLSGDEVQSILKQSATDALFGSLSTEYQAWAAANGLAGAGDAMEALHAELTVEQRAWLTAFIDRWEAVERAEAIATPTTTETHGPLTATDALAGAITYLELAHDVHEGDSDTANEVKAIMDALQAMLDQKGCEHFDPAVTDGRLTTLIDVIVNG